MKTTICFLMGAALVTASAAVAQSTKTPLPSEKKKMTDKELIIAMNNPVAAVSYVPFQINFDFEAGPDGNGWQNVSNFQPIVPFVLSDKWNLITRTIIPYMYIDKDALPAAIPEPDRKHHQGLSDTSMSLFFSPRAQRGDLVWGVGPALLFPTATDPMLGTKKFGAGPSFIALKQVKSITVGGLANHIWSYASVDSRREDVSLTFLQPFFAYVTPSLWNFTVTSETTYNWKSEEWTVPLDLVASRLFTIGKQKISVVAGPRFYLVNPDDGPKWGIRLVVAFILPDRW